MSFSLAAFAPHSPMLLPAIGKNNLASLTATLAAWEQLSTDLADKEIETVIIISPLGIIQPETYTLNLEPTFKCRFESFGDLATDFDLKGDTELAHKLKKALSPKHQLQLTSVKELDYGSAVPLFFIRQKLPKIKILPLYPAATSLNNLFAFGQDLKHAVELSPKKIAIIASGSLSQRLSTVSPAGYSPKARGWDKKIIKALLNGHSQEILQQDEAIRAEVKELSLNALAILMGCLHDVQQTPRQLSYEHPFGLSFLVLEFLT